MAVLGLPKRKGNLWEFFAGFVIFPINNQSFCATSFFNMTCRANSEITQESAIFVQFWTRQPVFGLIITQLLFSLEIKLHLNRFYCSRMMYHQLI